MAVCHDIYTCKPKKNKQLVVYFCIIWLKNICICIHIHITSYFFTINVCITWLGWGGCAMVEAVIRLPVTAETQIRSQVSPRGIFGAQSGTGTGFSPILMFSPVSIIPPISILIHSSTTDAVWSSKVTVPCSKILENRNWRHLFPYTAVTAWPFKWKRIVFSLR